jgi:GntR family transcriptional regulator
MARTAKGLKAIEPPRYHRVYVGLRTWIRDGSYAAGAQIPTEPELCKMFGVSRITVRKAIDHLVAEGWLVRQQGRGTFVQLSAVSRSPSLDIDAVRSQVADLAASTEVRDLRTSIVAPDEETRAALNLADGELVHKAVHVRLLRGEPLGVITTYAPCDIAARVGERAMTQQPMFQLLERAGIAVREADQLIGATLAGVDAARALGIAVGAPLLRLTRVVFDSRRRPVERVIALYRADAYQYRMHLGRTRARRRAAPKA